MKVVVAPDSFGGTLTAREAAAAIARGWAQARPGDQLTQMPMSDGGEGLLDVVATNADTWLTAEVADPLGHPRDAAFLLRADGTAVVESAEACGLHLVAAERRNPLHTTSYGVGQLLDAARRAGARRILVGLGGSATVDGGAGALTGLGFRLRTEDGGGVKVGGDDLCRIAHAGTGWASGAWSSLDVELLADVETVLADAARVFGPQKGATPQMVARLEQGLAVWAEVAERDLPGASASRQGLAHGTGTGAAGGLGFGLAAALGARLRPGARAVADLVGLDVAVHDCDVVVTGEGRLDATTAAGKVVSEIARLARIQGARALVVAGQVTDVPPGIDHHEAAAPDGPGMDAAGEVAAAAERLAGRL